MAIDGDLTERFHSDATRYTTNTLPRSKLRDPLQRRDVAPRIFESQDEATRNLRALEATAKQ
jgi:hypothetical protein